MSEEPERLNVRVKFVKKASQWCTTYFIRDNKGKLIQKQEWSMEKPGE